MYNLIKSDLFKLRKSVAIKILLLITTITSIIMITMAYLIQHGKLSGSTGIGFMFSDINVISILGAAVAGIIICGDFDNRTIHEAIANGNSRVQVVLSKAFTFWCGILIILLPYVIVTIASLITGYKFSMGKLSIGFLNIITTEAGRSLSSSQILKLLIIMIVLILSYAAQLSICIPFAISFKKSVIVIVVYYAITILNTNLSGLEKTSKGFKRIFQLTPYEAKYSIITLSTSANDILKVVIVSLIFIIVMLTITCLAFRKSEIK